METGHQPSSFPEHADYVILTGGLQSSIELLEEINLAWLQCRHEYFNTYIFRWCSLYMMSQKIPANYNDTSYLSNLHDFMSSHLDLQTHRRRLQNLGLIWQVRGARAYITGVWWAEPQAGSRGRAPRQPGAEPLCRGRSSPEAESYLFLDMQPIGKICPILCIFLTIR